VLEKLAAIKRRWEEVEQKLSDPKVIGDMKEFKKFNKEYKDLTAVVNAYHEYKNVIELSFYNGFTQDEIANSLNIPLGTVKTRLRNALIELRKQFV